MMQKITSIIVVATALTMANQSLAGSTTKTTSNHASTSHSTPVIAGGMRVLPPIEGCEFPNTAETAKTFVMEQLLNETRPYLEAPTASYVDDPSIKQVEFGYQDIDPEALLGCPGKLRQFAFEGLYDHRPTGPVLEFVPAKTADGDIPGSSLRLALHNTMSPLPTETRAGQDGLYHMEFHDAHGNHSMPSASSAEHGYVAPAETDVEHNGIHGLNTTNIHTHGWHVDPTGNLDNVFVDVGPGDTWVQDVKLPADHPSGTFWFHAHKHGSTAVQVSSGAAGALIVRDETKGLDATDVIKQSKERIMMLQQLTYNESGVVESIDHIQIGPKQTTNDTDKPQCDLGYHFTNRPIFINGLAVPTMDYELGSIERWRLIHTGSINGTQPMVTSAPSYKTYEQKNKKGETKTVMGTPGTIIAPLYEIATDGLPTGKIIPMGKAELAPAYRSDVLFQLTTEQLKTAMPGWDGTTPVTLYLSNGEETPMQTVTHCDPSSKGGKKSVNIHNARHVLAIINIKPQTSEPKYTLASSYDTPEVADQFAKALKDYQYGEINYADPKKKYDGVGPLKWIEDQELNGNFQIVEYYGDANHVYQCDPVGGYCNYCGGQKIRYEYKGKTYQGVTNTVDNGLCKTAAKDKLAHAEKADDHGFVSRPLINFMVCDSSWDVKPDMNDKAFVELVPNSATGKTDPVKVSRKESGFDTMFKTIKRRRCMTFNVAQKYAREFAINSANEWSVHSVKAFTGVGANPEHVFHIHVNPFQVARAESTDYFGQTVAPYSVWKDTLLTNTEVPSILKTRYTRYTGAFVQHCHVLTHEDQGMMQVVGIEDPDNPHPQ